MIADCLTKKTRAKSLSVRGRKSFVDWAALPPGEFRDDEVKNVPLPKATLAGHERPARRTKSWGSGSRFIKRDLEKAKFYAD